MPESAADRKDTGRDGRLSISNQAEYALRKELNRIALKACNPVVKKFVDCSKREGFFVVFNCRAENREQNECLKQYTNDKAFEEYKAKRAAELQRS